jgi:hypothetical protein
VVDFCVLRRSNNVIEQLYGNICLTRVVDHPVNYMSFLGSEEVNDKSLIESSHTYMILIMIGSPHLSNANVKYL